MYLLCPALNDIAGPCSHLRRELTRSVPLICDTERQTDGRTARHPHRHAEEALPRAKTGAGDHYVPRCKQQTRGWRAPAFALDRRYTRHDGTDAPDGPVFTPLGISLRSALRSRPATSPGNDRRVAARRARRRGAIAQEVVMGVQVTTIRPGFVAEIIGLDISRPVPPDDMAALWEASDATRSAGFPRPDADRCAADRLYREFRPAGTLRVFLQQQGKAAAGTAGDGGRIAPVLPRDKPQTGSQRHRMVNLGNRLLHTDSSFRLPRGGFSLLYAHAVPPHGPLGAGETEFADTCAAYEALHPRSGRRCCTVSQAEHSLMHSRARAGIYRFRAGGTRSAPTGRAAAGQHPSAHRAKVDLHRVARLAHHRHGSGRWTAAAHGADRTGDAGRHHVSPRMAGGRPCPLGTTAARCIAACRSTNVSRGTCGG